MTDPKIGLVLGGGGARGLAHIAILEAIEEMGLKPTVVAGASIGAIFGSAYCSGIAAADLRRYAISVFSDRAEVFSRLFKVRFQHFANLIAPALGNPAQMRASQLLNLFLPEETAEDFSELKIPLSVVVTDFYGHGAHAITKGDLREAVAASMAIPIMFQPVLIDGRVYVDGGASNPLPVDMLPGEADIIIAVDVVNAPQGRPDKIPQPCEAMFGASQLLMQEVAKEKLRDNSPDILLRPNINVFRV